MRQRLPIIALAAVVTIVALVVLTGGSDGGVDPVARAADATVRVGGAHMSIAGSVTAPGLASPMTISGDGVFSFKHREGRLQMTIAGLPAQAASSLGTGSIAMTELFKADTVYIGSSLFAGRLPGGAHWLRLNLARVEQSLGVDPASLTSGSSNPAALLEYLEHAGHASLVGHEAVRGVATAHYAGTLDLLKVIERLGGNGAGTRQPLSKLLSAAGLREIPIGVWIDGQGLVRRMSMVMAMTEAGQHVGVSLRCEYFDFGATPSVTAPADSEVLDETSPALQALNTGA